MDNAWVVSYGPSSLLKEIIRYSKRLVFCRVVPGSRSLTLLHAAFFFFSVAPSSTPLLYFVYSKLVCLLPVGIFEHYAYLQYLFPIFDIDPEKSNWGCG